MDFRQASDEDVAKGCGVDAETIIETGRAETLRFATLTFAKPKVRAIDLPVFATLGLADTEAGVLGNDLLAGHRVAIDYADSELRIWRL